jgi:hypothetical protein
MDGSLRSSTIFNASKLSAERRAGAGPAKAQWLVDERWLD